jgi:hypothetical protein
MVSHHIFYQLVLLGLLWLCMMRHVMGPSDRPVRAPRPPQPVAPPRKRSKEPTPFAGLLHTPHGAACEPAAQAPEALPPPAPLPIISRRGRPREVDTAQQFCPPPTCAYRGWVGLGHLRANGHPRGGPWRQCSCTACEGSCQEPHGPPWQGKRVAPDLLVWAGGALAEDFLPFVNPNVSHFLSHLHYPFTTNPACIRKRNKNSDPVNVMGFRLR